MGDLALDFPSLIPPASTLQLESSPLDRFVGGNEDVYVADGAPRLQTIHLKQEEAHNFFLHLVHLCKPHGYALELNSR